MWATLIRFSLCFFLASYLCSRNRHVQSIFPPSGWVSRASVGEVGLGEFVSAMSCGLSGGKERGGGFVSELTTITTRRLGGFGTRCVAVSIA